MNAFRYDEEMISMYFEIINNVKVKKIIIRLRSFDRETINRITERIAEKFLFFQTHDMASNNVGYLLVLNYC